jgi:limonene 1,2-monooxygenase
MRFGYWLMPCHGPRTNLTLAYEDDLRLAERAEDLGFEEFWIGEHHSGGWELIPSPELFIAAAAQRTRRLRFGTGVISLPYHHPFLVAERMAFLDHLTRGRLVMGVGPGGLPSDVKMFGLGLPALRPMMDEALDIILRLYREDGPLTYEGRYWTLRDVVLQITPYQRPHMPLAVASIGTPHSLELAARNGLRVLSAAVAPDTDPDGLAKQWRFVERNAVTAGRVASRDDWSIQVVLYVADTTARAVEDIRAGATCHLADYWHHVGVRAGFEDYAARPGETIDLERVMRTRGWIVGDPDECVRRVQALQAASGGFGGLILTVLDWTSPEKWRRSEELFARYVMPELVGSNRGLAQSWDQLKADAAAGALPSPYGPPQKRLDEE